jgi:hypothetical protein
MCFCLRQDYRIGMLATALAAAWAAATPANAGGCEVVTHGVCLGGQASHLDLPAGVPVAMPFAVAPLDAGLSATTSLSTWREYSANQLKRKMEAAGTAAVSPVRAPHIALPLNVWTRVSMGELGSNATSELQIAAGADYQLSPLARFGVSTKTFDDLAQGAVQETVGAYANFKLLPVLSIETRGEWSSDSVQLNGVASEPSVSIAPRLSQRYKLENGNSLEPYVTFRNEILSGTDGPDLSSIGGGLTLDKLQSYSLSISTMVDGTEADQPNVNSRFQLKLPIN